MRFRMGDAVGVHAGRVEHQAHDRFDDGPSCSGKASRRRKRPWPPVKPAMLVLKAHDQRTAELCSAAKDAGIPVHEVTERDMWRMAWPGSEAPPPC